jgi:hypothetical protein
VNSKQQTTSASCAQMASLLLKTTRYSAKNAQKMQFVLRAIIYCLTQAIGERTLHPSISLSATIRMLVLAAICPLVLQGTRVNFVTRAANLEILGIQENLLMSV